MKSGTMTQIFLLELFSPEEVDDDPVKKAKLSRDDHTLITSTPQDDNNLVDKHFSATHHIKLIYFDDVNEYVEFFHLNQDEHLTRLQKN